MKIERLVDAIGGIDDELIQAAVNDDAFIMKQKQIVTYRLYSFDQKYKLKIIYQRNN